MWRCSRIEIVATLAVRATSSAIVCSLARGGLLTADPCHLASMEPALDARCSTQFAGQCESCWFNCTAADNSTDSAPSSCGDDVVGGAATEAVSLDSYETRGFLASLGLFQPPSVRKPSLELQYLHLFHPCCRRYPDISN